MGYNQNWSGGVMGPGFPITPTLQYSNSRHNPVDKLLALQLR